MTGVLTTRDLPFPAVVTSPDGRFWPLARLLVEGGELLVFEHTNGLTQVAARATVTDHQMPGPRVRGETPTWRVSTPEGDWLVTKGSGCGCGHPLKRANLQEVLART